MILLVAIVLGLLAGVLRAKIGGRQVAPPNYHLSWLVFVSFIPQYLAFEVDITRRCMPDWLASVALVGSQMILLVFVLLNRNRPGFWLLGMGLGMNFVVIMVNGGFMPISPQAVQYLAPAASAGSWQVTQRLWFGKDIVLPVTETNLHLFSDCLLLPTWLPFHVAFSAGDILISIGVFEILWMIGSEPGSGE